MCGWNDIDRSASARAARLTAAAAAQRRNDKRVCMRSMTCASEREVESEQNGSKSMNEIDENEMSIKI